MIGTKDGTSGRPSIHHDPSDYILTSDAKKRYSVPMGVNAGLLRTTYKDWEGSLVWLHMQEPLRWPYSLLCGDKSDEDFNDADYLSTGDTITVTNEILTYVMAIRVAKDFAVSRPTVTNWKLGRTRGPKELLTYLKKCKESSDTPRPL